MSEYTNQLGGPASIARLARLADLLHDPRVAESAGALREQLLLIRSEAQELIRLLDAKCPPA